MTHSTITPVHGPKTEAMKEIISIPNAARTFDALRSLGYNLNDAVADVVDNAVTDQVGADRIDITFHVDDLKMAHCSIQDNGCGMTAEVLEEAMRLGTETTYKDKDLGKFGMGMKTASLSHCNVLTVISKTVEGGICGYRWDMGHVRNSNEWSLLRLPDGLINSELKERGVKLGASGTIVIWDELFEIEENYRGYNTPTPAENYIIRLREDLALHLGMVFHRFIEGKVEHYPKLDIRLNGDSIKPWDPFFRTEKATREVNLNQKETVLRFNGRANAIVMEGFVLPHKEQFSSTEEWDRSKGLKSMNDSQGYYIYRADRIIRFGGWQGTRSKDEHIKLARIAIDIHPELDDLFRITVNKNKVHFPEQLRNHLKNFVNPKVTKKANELYRNAGKVAQVKNKVRNNDKQLDRVTKEVMHQEGVEAKAGKSGSSPVEVTNPNGNWVPNTRSEFWNAGDKRNQFEVVSEPLDPGMLWKVVADTGKLKVIVNSEHPFYDKIYRGNNTAKVTGAVDSLIVSLALGELINRTEQNDNLFASYKESVSKSLKQLIESEIL